MSQPSADLIRGVPLFSDLDDKTVERLAGEFIERHFDEGAAIATEGVDGLNFFIVASGEASVTVHGERRRHARPGHLVRRGRARRQVGALGDGDGDDADGGVRAPRLELPAVRRAAPGARLEAPRDPRRTTPRSPSPLDPAMAETVDATLSDAELVAGCRNGDPEAWNALVERFSRYVSAIATQAFRLPPHDAEDVFQNVFMRVFERLDSLRSDEAIRPVGRPADAELLPRPAALVRSRRAGRGGRGAGRRRRDRAGSTRR